MSVVRPSEGATLPDADETDISEFLSDAVVGGSCSVCKLLPKLPDDRRRKVEAAFRAERVSGQRIYDVLHDGWGYSVGLESVRRHRSRCVANG